MISRIGKLVIKLSISAVVCGAAHIVLPSRQVHAAQVDIPAGIFTALVAPAKNVGISGGGMKHVSLAINPDNGRIYTQGGDYSFQNYQQSYQQSFFSFSLAERLASPANPNAGWTLEQDYCRTDGGVQPKHPDFVGWTWDSKRHVFWMVPGVMEGSNDICPGETVNRTGDPNFIHNQLMTFDPVSRRWTVVNSDIGPDAADTWQSIYDPVTDSLIRMGKNGGTGGVVNIYDITSRSWSKYNLGPNALGQDISVWKEGLAADIVGRVIYTVDGYSGRLHRFNIDAKKMADLGPVPGGSSATTVGSNNDAYVAWDSVNSVLYFFRVDNKTLYIYHPDTATWETVPTVTAPAGLSLNMRHAIVFDPVQNALVMMGGTDGLLSSHIFLFRYKNTGGVAAPLVTFTGTPNAVASGSAATLTWSAVNATSCSASDGWSGAKGLSGKEQSNALTADTIFSLTCIGAGGNTTQSIVVTVAPNKSSPPAPTPQPVPAPVPTPTPAPAPAPAPPPQNNIRGGQWSEIANSKLHNVLPNPLPPGNPVGIITAWSGGAFDTLRSRLIVTGGGGADYGGNELYAFDTNTLTWARIWGPSPNSTMPAIGTPGCLNIDAYTDGNPTSRHSYGGLTYIPGLDQLWVGGGARYCSDYPTRATWTFSFKTNTWARKADNPWSQDLSMIGIYDAVTQHVFYVNRAAPLSEYDPVENTWTQRSTQWGGGALDSNGLTGAIDTKRRKFVAIGRGNIWSWDLDTPGIIARKTLATSGDTAPVNGESPGFEYDPVIDRFVAWIGGTDVYVLNMDTLVWTRVSAAANNKVTPTAPAYNGTFGRFRYVPDKDLFVLVNGIADNVFFYKLPAAIPDGPAAPAPAPAPLPTPAPTPSPTPPPSSSLPPTPAPSPVPSPVPSPIPSPVPIGDWMTMDERSTLTYLFNGTRAWGVHELGRDGLPRSGEGSAPPNQGRQGSFSDRNGVVLGNAPFAAVPYDPTPTPLQIDITTLAQNWQANGNRGLMLRATGPEVQFFSRNSRPADNPADRPYLRVTKANGEIVRLACLSDVSLDWRSPYRATGLDFFLAVNAAEGEVYRVAMQFEPVVADFVKVELVLTPFHADGPGMLQVYLLNPPSK